MLNSYFTALFTEYGKLLDHQTIEAVEFKDDPSYGGADEDEYTILSRKFGPPSVEWIADTYCDYAWDGRGFDDLVSAFKKLEKAGYMSVNPHSGVVKYDLNHIKMADESDPYGGYKVIII